MKVLGIGCLVVFLAVAAAVAFFVFRGLAVFTAPSRLFPRVTGGQVPGDHGHINISIRLENTDRPVTVVSIQCPRALGDSLQLSPPDGFRFEPLPLTDEERKDPEMVAFAMDFDAKNMRFSGNLQLLPNQETVLSIPAGNPLGASGSLTFLYEGRFGLGGHSSSFSVEINTGPAPVVEAVAGS